MEEQGPLMLQFHGHLQLDLLAALVYLKGPVAPDWIGVKVVWCLVKDPKKERKSEGNFF